MRADRLIAAMCVAVVTIAVVLAVAVFPGGRNGADDVLALSATPFPYTISWEVDTTGPTVAGQTFELTAVAAASGGGSGANLKDASYNLDTGTTLEVLNAPEVPVTDIAEGAVWQLRALSEGEAQLRISLEYTLSYNITGTPPGSYHVTAETSETIEVASPPPTPNGDVNGDGETNSIDAALVLQFTAGILLAPIPNSDVNLDGVQDSRDAALILQLEAGLIEDLPLAAG